MVDEREHPTPQHKVAHFMATFEDYERLEAALPLPQQINLLGHRADEQARWVVVTHAAMMRKYFQSGDKLQLSKVVRAAHACVIDKDYPESEWDEYIAEVESFQTRTIYNIDGVEYTESELLTHYLYGRYLHGDFTKWSLTGTTPVMASDGALWLATQDRVNRVRELAMIVRSGVEEGALDYSLT